MAKKDSRKKSSKKDKATAGAVEAVEAVRHAVERTFTASAEGAKSTRGRAKDVANCRQPHPRGARGARPRRAQGPAQRRRGPRQARLRARGHHAVVGRDAPPGGERHRLEKPFARRGAPRRRVGRAHVDRRRLAPVRGARVQSSSRPATAGTRPPRRAVGEAQARPRSRPPGAGEAELRRGGREPASTRSPRRRRSRPRLARLRVRKAGLVSQAARPRRRRGRRRRRAAATEHAGAARAGGRPRRAPAARRPPAARHPREPAERPPAPRPWPPASTRPRSSGR